MKSSIFFSVASAAVALASVGLLSTSPVQAASGGGCNTQKDSFISVGSCINVSDGVFVNPDAYVTFYEKPSPDCRLYIVVFDARNHEKVSDAKYRCSNGHFHGTQFIGEPGGIYFTQVSVFGFSSRIRKVQSLEQYM